MSHAGVAAASASAAPHGSHWPAVCGSRSSTAVRRVRTGFRRYACVATGAPLLLFCAALRSQCSHLRTLRECQKHRLRLRPLLITSVPLLLRCSSGQRTRGDHVTVCSVLFSCTVRKPGSVSSSVRRCPWRVFVLRSSTGRTTWQTSTGSRCCRDSRKRGQCSSPAGRPCPW